jgi:hypothetical protein
MKKEDVKLGQTYLVKVAGNLVPVKIINEHDNGGWIGEIEKSGKPIRVKSPQRLCKCLSDAKVKPAKRILTKTEYEAEANQDAPVAKQRNTGKRDAKGTKREGKAMSLLDAAAHLLSLGTGDPMRCKDIVDLTVTRNLWTPRTGLTPANTLSAAIRREIKNKGNNSRFRLAERGKFKLNF